MTTREKSVADAIEYIKTCPLKGTFVKLELEANLNRGNDDEDYYDDDYDTCGVCEGDGTEQCEACPIFTIDEPNPVCQNCDNTGHTNCSNCGGDGQVESEDHKNYSDTFCQEFILDRVSAECRQAITYSTFYYDGSVDSEFSVTIPIEHPEYGVELIKAFRELGDRIGNGIDTRGAGMHIAILTSKDGSYRSYGESGAINQTCWQNFQSSMNHMMPALYFLASADHRSRPLGYRSPEVTNDKGGAISFRGEAIEWRVFETCYDNPEMFYDHLCVIANTLKFFAKKKVELPFFNKIGSIRLPSEGGGVARFFYTERHLDALEATLEVLRPAHRTKAECYKLRSFKTTKRSLRLKNIKHVIAAESEFEHLTKDRTQRRKELKEATTQRWKEHVAGNRLKYLNGTWVTWETPQDYSPEQAKELIDYKVKEALAHFDRTNPRSKKSYVQKKLNELTTSGHQITVAV